MQKLLLFLFFFALSVSPAKAQSFDNISRKYPIDAECFAYEASIEIAKKYPPATNFALVSAKKRDAFIDKFASFLRQGGFIIGQNPTVTIHYTLDHIDEQRAFLNLVASDGTDVGIVRNLGQTVSPSAVGNTYSHTKAVSVGESLLGDSNVSSVAYASDVPRASGVSQMQTSQYPQNSSELPVHNMSSGNKYPASGVSGNTYNTYKPSPAWSIHKGSLRNQLDEFAKENGWELIWSADFDLDMKADATFSGTFTEFIEKLFLALPSSRNGLRVSIYKANQVIEILGE